MLSRLGKATTRIRRQLRNARLRPAARRGFKQFALPYSLHIGCGGVKLPGWVNIDISGDPRIVDICWDLRQVFPIAACTCSHIYSEHVLEHFDVDEGLAMLRECHRLLAYGGVLRIAMPSLEYLIASYQSEDWGRQDWLRSPEYQFIQTRAEMLNVAFRWWGHRWLYDRAELHRRLAQAGFHDLRNVDWGESSDPSLRRLENRIDSKLIVEARK